MGKSGNYEILEHTADVAVRITAPDLPTLFIVAAAALYDIIGTISRPRKGRIEQWELQANDVEQLLHDWLAELLYWFQVRKTVFGKIEFQRIDLQHLQARLTGSPLHRRRCQIRHEIKAITYHQLQVTRAGGKIQATIIFDV